MRLIPFVLLFGALPTVGCAAAIQHDLQRQSALSIFPTPHPDSVKITALHRERLGNSATWIATTPKATYDCSLEAGEHRPICVKREP